jgi:hypothetical protein
MLLLTSILLIAVFFLSFVSAVDYQLLCLDQGETIEFSECNSDIEDRTCESTNGCQYCVIEIEDGVYCPASLNACNAAGLSCTYFGDGSENDEELDIQDIFMTPGLPLTLEEGEEDFIDLEFDSNIYPISVKFILYKGSTTKDSSDSIFLQNENDLPAQYEIPSDLDAGEYTLKVQFTIPGKAPQEETLGKIIIENVDDSDSNSDSDSDVSVSGKTSTKTIIPGLSFGNPESQEDSEDSESIPINVDFSNIEYFFLGVFTTSTLIFSGILAGLVVYIKKHKKQSSSKSRTKMSFFSAIFA